MTDPEILASETDKSLLEGALDLAQRGWKIFPLIPNGKVPLLKRPHEQATTDPEVIRTWWEEEPNANIGIPTGDGLVVLDVDVKGGKNGRQSLRNLNPDDIDLRTRTVHTPSGGVHYYYNIDGENFGNKVDFRPGLDVRGKGGLVVAPPSIIDGKRYTLSIDEKVIECPFWLRDSLTKSQRKTASKNRSTRSWSIPPELYVANNPLTSRLHHLDPDLPTGQLLS